MLGLRCRQVIRIVQIIRGFDLGVFNCSLCSLVAYPLALHTGSSLFLGPLLITDRAFARYGPITGIL